MSEIIKIPLGGVSNEPNDYDAEEGGLSVSINAVKHHGSLRPVMEGTPVEDIRQTSDDVPEGTLPQYTDVVAIHEVGNMKHYILVKRPDDAAGARPTETKTTVHYLCEEDKATFWWTSNYITDEASELHLVVGVGSQFEWVIVPYGQTVEVSMVGIAVDATYHADGSITHTMYDYSDISKHLTADKSIRFMRIRYGDGSETTPSNVEYQPHYPKTTVNIALQCLPDRLRLGYASSGYWNIKYIVLQVGAGTKTWAIGAMAGETHETSGTNSLSVGTSDDGTDIMYNHPTSVLTEDTVHLAYMVDTNDVTIPGLRLPDGSFNTDSFEITITVSTLDNQEPIGTGSSSFFPSGEKGDYRLLYIDANATDRESISITRMKKDILGVSTMGNVLVVSAKDEPLNYIIWKDGEYHVLGSEVEAPRVYPYLISRPMGMSELYSQFGANFMADSAATGLNEENLLDSGQWQKLSGGQTAFLAFNATQQKFVYDKTFAIVNAANNILSTKGFFYAPFFVRFALRMFDGTHVMHTPPQLMIAGAEGKPLLGVEVNAAGTASLHPVFVASRLCADIHLNNNNWEDLITHVDVFVSQPLINYTDDANAIAGATEANILTSVTPEDAGGAVAEEIKVGTPTAEYKPIYIQNRKKLSNFYQDYIDPSNKSSYINLNARSIPCNATKIFNNDFERSAAYFYLIDKTRYPNIKATYVDGTYRTLPTASESLVIGKTGGDSGESILLSDTGLTSLTNYVYFRIQSTDTSTQRMIILQGYESVDVTEVWCYRSTLMETRTLNYMLDLKRTDGMNYKDVIGDNNTFHLVKSIPTIEMKGKWSGDLFIEEHILDNLHSRPTLSDNGQMRSRITTNIMPFAYNNRLSMATGTWEMPSTSNLADFCVQNEPNIDKQYYVEKAWVKGVVNGQVVYKQLSVGTSDGKYTHAENIRYFYYPCYDATELILQVFCTSAAETKPCQVQTYALTKHKLLNGAYCFNNFESLIPTKATKYTNKEEMQKDAVWENAENGTSKVVYGNMVRVSGVSNPFYFNETNQVTLPSGNISGLSTTSQALSQGQFGAFPLYCFSDNGIWALEVSETGTYSAKQPVSRAVCTNPKSITQTEGQVLFVTKRGLMAISGSTTECVSTVLSGHNYTTTLSKLSVVLEKAGLENVQINQHIEQWLEGAQFLYDDKRQYIYAFREDDVLGYIYSMDDKAWGMFVSDLAHPLPCYTDALAVTKEDTASKQRRLINMSKTKEHSNNNPITAPKSVVITRPLTLGVPDGYKTLESLITRGMLDTDDAKLVVWASNDLKTWRIIATSTTTWMRGKSGTPYKYFRFGLILDSWEEEDSVSGFSAEITPRLNNRLR